MYKNILGEHPKHRATKTAYDVLKEIGPCSAATWFDDPRLEEWRCGKQGIIHKLHAFGAIERVDKTKNWAGVWRVRRWFH